MKMAEGNASAKAAKARASKKECGWGREKWASTDRSD